MENSVQLALQALLGLLVFPILAWGLSENRQIFPWRLALVGIPLQLVLAGLFLSLDGYVPVFAALQNGLAVIDNAVMAGTSFVFGYLGGGDTPFAVTNAVALDTFAFRILPVVIFMSMAAAVLWHWGILPRIIYGFTWLFNRTMGVSGAASFAATANMLLSFIESILLVKPRLPQLDRSDLFVILTAGMATVAGTLFVPFALIMADTVVNPVGHIITASILSVPASIILAKIMIPGVSTPAPLRQNLKSPYTSTLDAFVSGATSGGMIIFHALVLLIVVIATVHFFDAAFVGVQNMLGVEPLKLQDIVGYIMQPLAWLMGIPLAELGAAGWVLGTKLVLNEFVAFLALPSMTTQFSPTSLIILTYAICGFANFGTVGVLVATTHLFLPDRKQEVSALALKALIPATLALCMTGSTIAIWLYLG